MFKRLRKFHYTPSLSRDFLALTLLVLIGIGGLTLWFAWKVYHHQSQIILDRLEQQSNRITRSYEELLEFTAYQVKYIAQKIYEKGSSPEYVGELLSTFQTQSNTNLFWSTFLWADHNHQVRVTNDFGILDNPKNLATRDYIPKTKTQPGTLHLGKPVYGITSGKWAIPGGYGVIDQKGLYRGAVVTGLMVTRLIHHMEKNVNLEGISFAILDEELHLIGSTYRFEEQIAYNGIAKQINKISPLQNKGILKAKSSDMFDSGGYGIYEKLPNSPFILLVSYDKHQSNKEIWELLGAHIIEMIAISIILILTLALLKYRVINPLSQLSQAAHQISMGAKQIQLPRHNIIEIRVLSKQLLRVQRQLSKIRRMDGKLRNAVAVAEQANLAKSQFLASIGHELRTPLNAIIGYSEMMKEQILGPLHNKNYQQYTSDIHKSGLELLRLINEILDIVHSETNQFDIKESVVHVPAALDHAMNALQNLADEKLITIEKQIQSNLPQLFADELRIKQIFFHLLSNALKFSNMGQLVTISLYTEQDSFIIAIKDHGQGMAPKDIPKALEKFSQIDGSIARKEEGAGLGLWLTKLFVEAHQGKLKIDSILGKGTTVMVTFPPSRIISPQATEKSSSLIETSLS